MAINNLSEKIHYTRGNDITASNTLNLTTDGDYFHVIGSSTINELSTLGVGMQVVLTFKSVCQIVHNPDKIIIPGGDNIDTSPNDSYKFIEYDIGKWIVIEKPNNNIVTDPTAIHSDKNNEINQILAKSNFDLADIFLIEDSTDSWNKKKIPFGQISIDNIADGTNYKKYLPSERNKLIGIEDNADVTDVLNVSQALGDINVNRLRDITSDGADIEDAVSKRHTQGDDTTLGVQSENSDWGNYRITNLGDPIDDEDAATKNYVDNSAFFFKLKYNGTDLTYSGENLIYYRTESRDVNAIHKNSSGEITTIFEKSSISSNDIFIIEDSEDSWSKKKIEFITLSDNIISVSNITAVLNSISVNALSDITSPGADIEDSVSKRHTQGTDTTLGVQSVNSDWGTYRITNLGEPIDDEDAATKNYVDTHGGGGGTDINAIHVNESDEINGIAIKSKCNPQDVFVIEDSKDSMNKKKTSIYQDPAGSSYFIKNFNDNNTNDLYDDWFFTGYSLISHAGNTDNFASTILPSTYTNYFLLLDPWNNIVSQWIDKYKNIYQNFFVGSFDGRKGILGTNKHHESIHIFDTQNTTTNKQIFCQSVHSLETIYFTHYLSTQYPDEKITSVMEIGNNFLVATYRTSISYVWVRFYLGFESSWTNISEITHPLYDIQLRVSNLIYDSSKNIVADLEYPYYPVALKMIIESTDGGYTWIETISDLNTSIQKIINIGNDELLYLTNNGVDTSYIYKKDASFGYNDYRLLFSINAEIKDIIYFGKGFLSALGGSFSDPDSNIIGYSNDRGETWFFGLPDCLSTGSFNNALFNPIDKKVFYANAHGYIIYKVFDQVGSNIISFYPYLTFGDIPGDCYYGANFGEAVKIGNIVFFKIDIFINTTNSWIGGNAEVSGLPFNTNSISYGSTCLFRGYNVEQVNVDASLYGIFFNNSNKIQLGYDTLSGHGEKLWTPYTRSNFSDSGCEIHLSGHYFTDE